ncbi:protein PYRICULARIA ORYZAE RESISTANCE 21-like [Nicotiana tomentosiformis]|uniref:protein PYRICULARIA ORYZAE RESISTANCE 21-like n=1 Tax=Nicotiana tomentosiformis TaxID=4098 RepID=UPI00051B0A2D|nr:pollen-specific leucine-rich repeat extensin-like protein 2 [Nicotiana tomentosiformis]
MGGDNTEKTTVMVLKVDLQCPCCYKKAKKVLCKMPQVRDQVYDEKANTVTITVVCCSPENIRDKLCCKGGKAIKSIEIKEPGKPKVPEKPKDPEKPKGPEKPKEPEKPKGPEKPKDKPKEPEKGKTVTFEKPKEPEKPKDKTKEPEKPKDKAKDTEKPKQEKPTIIDKPKQKDPEKPKDGPTTAMVATPWVSEPVMMMPVQGYPQAAHGCGCGQCYYTGGPCYQYYGTPVPQALAPTPYYGNYSYGYGPGSGPSGYGKGPYVNSEYFSEENATGCTIM